MRSAHVKPPNPFRRLAATAALALGLLAVTAARADDVAVAVAANFLEPLKALQEGFTAKTGHRLKLSGGSTGESPRRRSRPGSPPARRTRAGP